jgi:uncharacterized protein
MLVGLVSDTHGYLDPRLIEAFAQVEVILHAGDVGSLEVLEGLSQLAPVHAVHGNNDLPLGGLGLPETIDTELDGLPIHVVHELPRARPREQTRLVMFGHSHRPLVEQRAEVVYVNPGAAGRRGFHSLQTAALLRIFEGEVAVELITLGPRLKMK